jgi:hypothetical protein
MDHAGFLHETRVKLGRGCDGLDGGSRWMGRIRLTFLDNSAVITGEIWLAAAAWRKECGTGCPPQVVGGVR